MLSFNMLPCTDWTSMHVIAVDEDVYSHGQDIPRPLHAVSPHFTAVAVNSNVTPWTWRRKYGTRETAPEWFNVLAESLPGNFEWERDNPPDE